jgi:hypothetical protein
MKWVKSNFLELLQYFALFVSAIYNFDFFAGTKLYGNAASRVLLAVGPMLGIGNPYKDLYELVPPGYLIFIAGWVRLFGLSMDSFRFIQVFLVLINGFFLIKVLDKLFEHKLMRLFIFLTLLVTVNSWVVQTDFFSIDYFATTLILGGLAALLQLKNKFIKIPLAATLFILASQIKDIYLLSVIALLPFYLCELLKKNKRDFLKLVLWSAGGPLIIFAIILAYLSVNDSLASYITILQDKTGYAQDFSPKLIARAYLTMLGKIEQAFLILPNLFFGLLAINGAILMMKYKSLLTRLTVKKIRLPKLIKQIYKLFIQQLNSYGENLWGKIVLTTVLLIFVLYGLTIYGLYFGSQLTMIATSYYLAIGILLILPLQVIATIKSSWLKVILTLFLFAIFIPKHIPRFFNFVPMQRVYPFEIEKDILARVDKDECILHVHGWEIAISYIYTARRPCSRYFLANELFNIRRPGVIEEYRQDLFNDPPAAFLYNEKGSDLDIEKFDAQVINFRRILKNCYEPDPKYTNYMKHFFAQMTLYWPKANLSKEELKACWVQSAN